MLMLAQPLEEAITAARKRQAASGADRTKVIYLSPQGRLLNHDVVMELRNEPALYSLPDVMKAWMSD